MRVDFNGNLIDFELSLNNIRLTLYLSYVI